MLWRASTRIFSKPKLWKHIKLNVFSVEVTWRSHYCFGRILGLIRKWCCRIPGTHDAKSGVVREDMFIWWEGRWPTTLPLHRSLKLPVIKDFRRTSIYCAECRQQLKRRESGMRKIFLTIMRGFKYLGVFLKQSWVASLSSSFYKFIRLCGGMLYQWFPSWVPENSRVSWNPRFLQCVL